MNTNTTGHASFTARQITVSRYELQIHSVENGPGKVALQQLIGSSPECEAKQFPVSTVSKGGRNQRPVNFRPTQGFESLTDGKKYGALITFTGNLDDDLIVNCIADFGDYEKATKVQAGFKPGPDLRVVEDPNMYHVHVQGGHEFRGNLRYILDQATHNWDGDDPTEALLNEHSQWQKKGADKKYAPCDTPTSLPLINKMIRDAAAKKAKA